MNDTCLIMKQKPYFYTIVLIALLFVSSSYTLGDPPIDPCNSTNKSFVDGEHVVYKIYYNWNFVWLSAGEVNFYVTETKDHYIIEATGKTYRSYEVFFRVNDYYKTKIRKSDLLPVEFERNIEEGGYRFYNRIEFDQEGGTALSFSGRTKETVVAQEYPLETCMHDMLSTVYFLRNMSFDALEERQRFPIEMFIDDKVYPIDIAYEGKGSKKIKGYGKIDAVKVSPEVVAGVVFSTDAKMNIWVSDDENKVPIVIESPISVGSIQAILKSHSGLKYPLGS